MINKKTVITTLVILLTLIAFAFMYRMFLSEKVVVVDEKITSPVIKSGESIFYITKNNNYLSLKKLDIKKNQSLEVLKINDLKEVTSLRVFDDGKYIVLLGYNTPLDPNNYREPELMVIKSGEIIKFDGPAPSDLYQIAGDLFFCYQEDSGLEKSDGYFYSLVILKKEKKVLKKYSSDGVSFVGVDHEKNLLFQSTSPNQGWKIDKIYTINTSSGKIDPYLEIEGLVGINIFTKELATLTVLEDEKYNVYQYNLITGQKEILSKNNFGIRTTWFDNKYYGLESIDKNKNIYTFQEDKSGDVFKELYPRSKVLTKNKLLTGCYSPMVVNKKYVYLSCNESLLKIKNFLR